MGLKSDWTKTGFATRAIHGGQEPDPSTGAIMTPIFQTSTFVQESPGVFKGYEYSRTSNPTRVALEGNLASIEGAKYARAFASGSAATAAILGCLDPGDHVLCGDDVYGGSFRLMDKVYRRFGLEFSYVDQTDLAAVKAAIRPNTKLCWIETPTNPTLKVADIEEICSLCNAAGVASVVDNTFATPFLQLPLSLGATMVAHSTTKYLGGHSDVVGGAVITNDEEWMERVQFILNCMGGNPGPQDCFLTMRGIKTLHVRMDRHCDNAEKCAAFLESHPGVSKVIYPGLASHPQHDIAAKQMKRFGGMISFHVVGGLEAARRFLESVQVFSLAESLGGVESLIEHPAIMTHASVPAEAREALGIHDDFIRLSVGIEEASDLIEDLEQALAKAKG
ncbi:MAG: cystathionine gamma-synthase [Myxococcota bacterium]|nr:cystathionine gamma-synthase [Myxococcota bacterium]